MKTISRVLGVLVFASWAGSVSAERVTGADKNTVDGIARVNADPGQSGVEQSPVITSTGQMAGRVFVNPETGKLGGPPAGAEPPGLTIATKHRLSRSDNGLQTRRSPDGSLLVDLQGRFQNMSVVTLGEDGRAHVTCSHSVDQTEKVLAHSANLPIEHRAGKP